MSRQNDRRGLARRAPAATAIAVVLALLAMLGATPAAIAEFATGGAGIYRGSVDWFEWGPLGDEIAPTGATVSNTRTVGGVSLVTSCTIGAVTGSPLEVTRPGDTSTDGLDDLYNAGGTGPANGMLVGLANAVDGGTSTFPVTCSATLAGGPVSPTGIVVATAGTNGTGEYLAATVSGASWRALDRYRDATCAENPVIAIEVPAPGEQRLVIEGTAACDASPVTVAVAEGATTATVEVHGVGRTAIAIGVMLDSDFGDAPASYGDAGALFFPSFDGPVLAEGDQGLFDLALSTRLAPSGAMLGSAITSESGPQPSAAADLDAGDDALAGGFSFDANPGATVTRTVSCKASTYVAGWLDWDRDGAFAVDEATAPQACAAGTATLSWAVPADATPGASYLRLRAGRALTAVASAVGLAGRGEVEDYAVTLMGAIPFVSCTTDPEVFNTGYDSSTGTVLADGSPDARWTIAGGTEGFYGPNGTTPPASTSLPPGGAVWAPAEVGKINGAWSDSPYPTANYISADYVPGTNQVTLQADWYFRFQFDLDPMVDLASFQLDMRWLADNSVAGIWVNNVAQTGTNLPQNSVNPYHHQGFLLANAAETRLDSDWQAGLNTIIVQMKSSNLAEGFLAFVDSTAVCIEPKALTIDKTSDVADLPADDSTIAYTVTVTNLGPGDYTVEDPATMSDDLSDVLDDGAFGEILAPASGASYAAGVVSWSGPLAAGDSVDIVYTVVYDADAGGDHVLLNTACVPVDEAPTKAEACASTQTPGAALEIAKTVDPADGTAVHAGDTLTYTLTFTNVGATPAVLNTWDDLTDLLDDADLGPITADPGLVAVVDGTDLDITGTVPVGAPLTVVYTATVRPFEQQGDHVVTNLLLCPAGAPDSCAPIRTDNPIPHVVATKTSDRPEGSTVYAGSVVVYTLTFTNDGAAADEVHATDDLSDVLDDADLVVAPTADLPHQPVTQILQVGDAFVINIEPLEAGGTATVSYAVRVRSEADRGNDLLRNLLQLGITTVSTQHPVGSLAVGKTPLDALAVVLGDEVVWTITAEIPDEPVSAFVITDVLDVRLDYVSTSVALAGPGCPALGGGDVDVSAPAVGDAGLLTVAFTNPAGLAVLTASPDCVVSVTIRTSANAIGEIPNEASVFPNQGSIDTGTPLVTAPVETRWGEFTLRKVDGDGGPLTGARFSIHPDLASAQAGGPGLELAGESVFEVTAPSGELTLSGLRYSDFADGAPVGVGDPGYRVYYLVEVRAPLGHELLAEPVPVAVTAASTAAGVDVVIADPPSNAGYVLPPAGGPATAAALTGLGLIGLIWALLVIAWFGRRRLAHH